MPLKVGVHWTMGSQDTVVQTPSVQVIHASPFVIPQKKGTTHALVHARIRALVHVQIRALVHARIRARTHVPTHVYIRVMTRGVEAQEICARKQSLYADHLLNHQAGHATGRHAMEDGHAEDIHRYP